MGWSPADIVYIFEQLFWKVLLMICVLGLIWRSKK